MDNSIVPDPAHFVVDGLLAHASDLFELPPFSWNRYGVEDKKLPPDDRSPQALTDARNSLYTATEPSLLYVTLSGCDTYEREDLARLSLPVTHAGPQRMSIPEEAPVPWLPLFVYGSLRPGELAHRQITNLITRVQPATAHGLQLSVRDGLPFAQPEDHQSVEGDVLWPRRDRLQEFYRLVRDYEGTKLYSETDRSVTTADGEVISTRIFVGKRVTHANPEPLGERWTSAQDPLFSTGLDAISDAGRRHFRKGLPALPADHPEFWRGFLPLQGLYLVLCTVLERYTALVFGPTVDPMKRVARLRDDPDAIEAVRLADPPALRVFDSRNAQVHYSAPGRKPFDAWYQVRSNLTHRGKAGGIHDFRLVEKAVVGLHDAMRHLLAKQLPLSDTDRAAFCSGEKLLGPVYHAARGD